MTVDLISMQNTNSLEFLNHKGPRELAADFMSTDIPDSILSCHSKNSTDQSSTVLDIQNKIKGPTIYSTDSILSALANCLSAMSNPRLPNTCANWQPGGNRAFELACLRHSAE
jgi:hypothetical protein